MLHNYLTITLRNLGRHPGYAVINVLGLATGLATCILIGMFVRYELSVDAWHEKGDRIYRVIRETRSDGDPEFEPRTTGALAIAMRRDFPDVEAAVRVWPTPAKVHYDGDVFDFDMVAADVELFNLFDLPFLRGSPATFTDPYFIALTESAARRVFGDDDPIGKSLSIGNVYHGGEYTVTAILEDVPRHSTLQFDFVTPPSSGHLTWVQWSPIHSFRPIWTYVLLRDDADANALTAKLPAMVERYMGSEIARTNAYHLQPFREAYLYSIRDYGFSLFGGNIAQLYQFGAVSLFVLAIAGVNFTNLTTALSARRAREVGLRKVTGASRTQLIAQFVGESVMTALAALALALVAGPSGLAGVQRAVWKAAGAIGAGRADSRGLARGWGGGSRYRRGCLSSPVSRLVPAVRDPERDVTRGYARTVASDDTGRGPIHDFHRIDRGERRHLSATPIPS